MTMMFSAALFFFFVTLTANAATLEDEYSSSTAGVCVNGKGDFVFRQSVPAKMELQACHTTTVNDSMMATGKIRSIMDGANEDEAFVYHVHCMHVDGNRIFLGTEVETVAQSEKDKQNEGRWLSGRGGPFCGGGGRGMRCSAICMFAGHKSQARVKCGCEGGGRRGLKVADHKDFVDENGKKLHLVESNAIDTTGEQNEENPKGSLAVFYLEDGNGEDDTADHRIGVKLHEEFDMNACVGFDKRALEIEFGSDVVDALTSGHVTLG